MALVSTSCVRNARWPSHLLQASAASARGPCPGMSEPGVALPPEEAPPAGERYPKDLPRQTDWL